MTNENLTVAIKLHNEDELTAFISEINDKKRN